MIPPRPNLDEHKPLFTYDDAPACGRWDTVVMLGIGILVMQIGAFALQWEIARALWLYWGW